MITKQLNSDAKVLTNSDWEGINLNKAQVTGENSLKVEMRK